MAERKTLVPENLTEDPPGVDMAPDVEEYFDNAPRASAGKLPRRRYVAPEPGRIDVDTVVLEVRLYDKEKVLADLDAAAVLQADADGKRRIESLYSIIDGRPETRKLAVFRDFQRFHDELLARFPNFSEVIEAWTDHLALAAAEDGAFRLPPTLLVGDHGIGKTELAHAVARLVGMEPLKIDISQTGFALTGSDRGYSNSQAGKLFDYLVREDYCNPIVFIDEIDKIHGDPRYNPEPALLGLLEEKTAKAWADLSAPEVVMDASHLTWLASANTTASISAPILSRFRVFHVPTPTPEQCMSITREIYKSVKASNRWADRFPDSLPDSVIELLVTYPPRLIKGHMIAACGRAVRQGRYQVIPQDIREVAGAGGVKRKMGFVA